MAIDYDKLDEMTDEDFLNAIENIDNYVDEDIEEENPGGGTTEVDSDTHEESDDDDQSFDEDDNDDIENGNNTQEEEEEQPEEEFENDDSETEEINYKAEYDRILAEKQRYEDFYNQATSEFVANGKKVKGFTDPKKIIEAQQMAAGFSEKMAGFKKYRPYMNALKEKGILENPDKFNLAMNLLDGDKEAIKKQIKDLNIDPFELDMDDINYIPSNNLPGKIELALDDIIESANQYGVGQEVTKIISKDWDDESVFELIDDPTSSADLVNHVQSGVYDIVQERIMKKKMTDINGSYGSKTSIQQYREAAIELDSEYRDYVNNFNQQEQQEAVRNKPIQNNNVLSQAKQADYAKKAAEKKALQDDARRKAASLSGTKRNTSQTKKTIDPLTDLDDEQFSDYMDSIMYQ